MQTKSTKKDEGTPVKRLNSSSTLGSPRDQDIMFEYVSEDKVLIPM
jgi:hypothetical protein